MTRKEKTIRRVLWNRVRCIDKYLAQCSELTPMDREYFKGKREGFMQAFSLVAESIESLRIEL